MSALKTFAIDDIEPIELAGPGLVRGRVSIATAKSSAGHAWELPELVRVTVIIERQPSQTFEAVLEQMKGAALLRLEAAADVLRGGAAADLLAAATMLTLEGPEQELDL